jgi:hypothetical protein
MTTSPDYYELLQISPDADGEIIQLAYELLVGKWATARNPRDPSVAEQILRLDEAYAVLSDPQRRRQYDSLRGRPAGAGAVGEERSPASPPQSVGSAEGDASPFAQSLVQGPPLWPVVVVFFVLAGMIGALAIGSRMTSRPPEAPPPAKQATGLDFLESVGPDGPLRPSPQPKANAPTAPVASPRTPQEVARTAFSSTVLLVMEDAAGQPLSLGSGFFVRGGEVASNLHVVASAARGYAKLVGQKDRYDIEGITAVDPGRDLVLLKVTARGSSGLPLANDDAVEVGENVYAVGNPRGLEGTFSQGIVSGVRGVGTDRLIQITAPISPGSSGGPVLNGRGEVVGVSVATIRGGQNLNLAIPSSYLKTLLAEAGPAKPLSRAKPTSTQRSLLSNFGGRSTEGIAAGNFAWNLPGNPFSGTFSFSLRNDLRRPVKNVDCLVVFRDDKGKPIDVDRVRFAGPIPPGLAKRVSFREVDSSVAKLTMWRESAVELRVLDFEIVE